MSAPVRTVFPAALLMALAVLVGVESALAQDFNQWLTERKDGLVAAREAALEAAKVHENGKGSSRQKENPSSDDRSTSLVDETSATDFLSVAFQFVPVSNIEGPVPGQAAGSTAEASQQGSGATSVTVTGYSLLALSNRSLTDPQFYASHTDARRFSVTLGTAASDPATDGTSQAGIIVGLKLTILNGRDLYSRTGREAIERVRNANGARGTASNSLFDRVQRLIIEYCQPNGQCRPDWHPMTEAALVAANLAYAPLFQDMTRFTLSPELSRAIDALIQEALPAFLRYQSEVREAYDQIRNARQLAVSYQVVKRPGDGNNDHRAGVSFDYGLTNRITWTSNASFDYKDRKQLADSRGGRVATEFKGNLTPESNDPLGPAPVSIGLAAEAKWLDGLKPQYTLQAKCSIPLGGGINLPIVYRLANRQAQISQTDSEARLGLSVDLARLVHRAR